MLNILESLNDVSKIEEDGTMADSLVIVEGQNPNDFRDDEDSYYDTDHNQRKMQLILSDPVHTVVLKDYLQSQVKNCLLNRFIINSLHRRLDPMMFLYLRLCLSGIFVISQIRW